MNELWLPVVGYEGLYEVSDLGGVRNALTRCMMARYKQRGYLRVRLSGQGLRRNYAIHNLVAAAFIGPKPEGLETCHGKRGRLCNEPSNLSYKTHQQNMDDMRRDGTLPQGEKNGRAMLNEQAVREIRSSSLTQRELASLYGVSKSCMQKIKAGKSWAHL